MFKGASILCRKKCVTILSSYKTILHPSAEGNQWSSHKKIKGITCGNRYVYKSIFSNKF